VVVRKGVKALFRFVGWSLMNIYAATSGMWVQVHLVLLLYVKQLGSNYCRPASNITWLSMPFGRDIPRCLSTTLHLAVL